MSQVAGALDAGAQVATLLPPMLGADGPRTYLLVSLNSAELRSAGGIVGAFAVLHAEDGAVDADRPALDHRPEGHRRPRSCRSPTRSCWSTRTGWAAGCRTR